MSNHMLAVLPLDMIHRLQLLDEIELLMQCNTRPPESSAENRPVPTAKGQLQPHLARCLSNRQHTKT